eukprot:UN03893
MSKFLLLQNSICLKVSVCGICVLIIKFLLFSTTLLLGRKQLRNDDQIHFVKCYD